MRRGWTIALLLLVCALLALPVVAQEPTLAGLLTEAAAGETPEFTTLLTALEAAGPSVLETLSDADASLTLFAPTDAAFASYAAALGEEAYTALLADPAALTDLLLYHVSPAAITYASLNGTVAGLAAQPFSSTVPLRVTIPTLLGQYLDVQAGFESLIIDNATLTPENADAAASNGVLHTIDAVLAPETNTIGDIFKIVATGTSPQFLTLTSALEVAGLLEPLSDADAEPVTIFAPTDAAFNAAFEALGLTADEAMADTELITRLVTYHLVPGIVSGAALGGAATADPAPAWFAGLDDAGLTLITTQNGATVTFGAGEDGAPLIGGAPILINDVDAANGLIHVIDAVLLPPETP